ncbi:hypothetical protein KP509_08G057900 [Ceratopteris richardii]|uniref:Uncharacterized protein n=1 Tax=Ceratopteris richardii TaxID=49495 RepID=A0A8T2UCM0_CERRI|nr:hypothetical protein KP509_08G057900 [Ceratopteris richardii]
MDRVMQPKQSLAFGDLLHRRPRTTANDKSLMKEGLTQTPSAAVLSSNEKEYPAMDAASEVGEGLAGFTLRELYISFRFVRYDLLVTVLPGAMLTLATHIKGATIFGTAANLTPIWRSLPSSIFWMWLFVYVTTLANQITGAEEDAVNKPSRPIPSKLVTISSAQKRFVWVCGLFVLVGSCLGNGVLSLAWVADVLVVELWGPSSTYLHWLTKPLFMVIGILIMGLGNPNIVGPITKHHPTVLYIGAIAIATGLFGFNIQDIRDVEGDRSRGGRRTLPLLVGEVAARHLCNMLLLCCWGILHLALKALHRPQNFATSMVILVWCIFLCIRTLLFRSPAQDHKTYMFFVYLYSFVLFSYLWAV